MALVVTVFLAAASGLLPTGSLQTVAGSGRGFPGNPGFAGDGGPATQARLARPAQVSADRRGGFYIADSSNQRIRYVSPDRTDPDHRGQRAAGRLRRQRHGLGPVPQPAPRRRGAARRRLRDRGHLQPQAPHRRPPRAHAHRGRARRRPPAAGVGPARERRRPPGHRRRHQQGAALPPRPAERGGGQRHQGLDRRWRPGDQGRAVRPRRRGRLPRRRRDRRRVELPHPLRRRGVGA